MLVEHFLKSIKTMPDRTRDHRAIHKIDQGLQAIHNQMVSAVDGFTKPSVREISIVCEDLLKEIRARG